jgi:streptogramin lyase
MKAFPRPLPRPLSSVLRALSVLVAFSLLSCTSQDADVATPETDPLAGLSQLFGSVAAEAPFIAAQVFAHNLDKNMLYTVFTNQGQYRTINLMPGGYEVWAEKGDLRSEHKMLRIQDGAEVNVDLELKSGKPFPLTQKTRAQEGVAQLTYDGMYPPGPGRDLLEQKCMACHGQSFFPSRHMTEWQWNYMIGQMLNPDANTRVLGQRGAMITGGGSVGGITEDERKTLAVYLEANFGETSAARVLKIDVEYPLDEAVLSKGLFIEYLLPLPPGADLTVGSSNQAGEHRMVEPHIDNSGNIWATNGMLGVSKLDPRTAEYVHYPYPEPGIFGHGMTVDSNGHVFWIEFNGQHVGRLDPATGKMERFPMDPEGGVRNIQGHTPNLDSKENVWFTVINGNRVGKWDRQSEAISLWEIPTPNSFPYGIEVDQNDEVWFAELWGCNVGRFNTRTEVFTEYPALKQPCAMNRLMADSKGVIWYSLSRPGLLGKLDPRTGEQKEFDVVPFRKESKVYASRPYGIIADHEDQVWFGDSALGGALIRFDPDEEVFTYYPLPRQTDNPNIDRTGEGAIVYTTRSNQQSAIGIFYPDASKMTGYGAYR